MDFIGVGGLLKDVYDLVIANTSAYNRSYNRALKKWTCNNALRERFADNYLADFDKLVKFVKDKSVVRPGLSSFYEILLDEIKKDTETATSITAEFSIEIYRLLNEVKGEISHISTVVDEIAGKRMCPVPEYTDVDDYIPLKVTCDETEEECFRHILSGNDEDKFLSDLIVEGEKHIILFSHPQHGKSTVLAKLTFDLQQSGIYKPLLFNLRNYCSNLSISEQTKLEQRLDNSSLSVLILDGLDELKSEHRENVISEIATLSDNYPFLNIVLSCRLSHKKFMTVNGFKTVYLKSMDWNGLNEYVNAKCVDPEGFLKNIVRSKIVSLFYVPFFLKESVRYFETHGRMPSDKVDIYEFFIERAFEVDGFRKPHRSAILKLRPHLYPRLEQLAFVMLVSQRMEVSPDDLVNDMDMSLEIVETLMGLSLITKGSNGELTFVHNAFKEYILAKKLSQFDSDRIKELICFPETEIIIPALKNVAVLLVHLIRSQGDWNSSEFRSWFVEHHPEILVEVGTECLDSRTRESIFLQIYNEHKTKGLFIDYGTLRQLMRFPSTQGSVEFVVREIDESESLDVNSMNALRLAEFADFSLLPPDRVKHAEDVFLTLLDKKNLPIGDYAYISLPLTNKTIISESLLERVLKKLEETRNCYLIKMVCSMTVTLGVSDRCADWVLSKAKYVCNYYENGVTHVISDYKLMEFIRSLTLPQNVLVALRFLLPYKRHYTDSSIEREKFDVVPQLLKQLSLLSDVQLLDKVVELVDSSHLENMPRKIAEAFREYFESVADINDLFAKRLQVVIEARQTKSSDVYLYWRMHNILSILLNEDLLNNLIERDQEGEFEVYSVLCQLRDYASRKEEEIALIDAFCSRKFPRTVLKDHNQEQFDILFERTSFKEEICRVFAGANSLDFDKDIHRIYMSGYNSSVIAFLRDIKDDDVIYIHDVLESFNDSDRFSVFVADRISSFTNRIVNVSNDQKEQICRLVHVLIPRCDQWDNLIYSLIRVIVNYDVPLSDNELMAFFAWAGVVVSQPQGEDISYSHRKFMDSLYNRINDKSLFVKGVKSALSGELVVYSMFYEAVADVVITNRIAELYSVFRDIVQRFEYNHEILEVMVKLLQLPDRGLGLSESIFDLLSEEDKLYFIDFLLQPEKKGSILDERVKRNALEYIESNYDTYSKQTKQKALRILFAYGRESALEWGFAMFDECDEWLYADDFPSITGYSGCHYERLAEYFQRAISGEQSLYPRPHPMYESVSTALKNIAMESKEMLENVKNLFRGVADEKKNFSYYNRIADELDVDYYSKNVFVPDLRQATDLYNRIHN